MMGNGGGERHERRHCGRGFDYIMIEDSPVQLSWPQLVPITGTLRIRLGANGPKESAMLGVFNPTCACIMKLLAGHRLSCQVLCDFPAGVSNMEKSVRHVRLQGCSGTVLSPC
jgi:hypothetical protein